LVSEVAANTTTVPVMFPDAAEAVPAADALDAGVLAEDEVLLEDDELHAVRTPNTAIPTTARILMGRGRPGRDARLTLLPSLHPAGGTLSLMSPPLPG